MLNHPLYVMYMSGRMLRSGIVVAATILWMYLMGWPHTFAAEPSQLGPDNWPTTVEATVHDLLARTSAADKAYVKATKKEDLIQFHHGWGTGIRNYYGLWRGNEKLILAACGRPCHPDDASMKIIKAVWRELQK
jgi:Domain of unknown function (DUF6794)